MDANRNRSSAGTLLWVGHRETAEFKPIFEFCVENASQVAVRRSIDDALRHPADHVIGIILARPNRARVDESSVNELISRHGGAQAMQLIGPLCAGDRHDKLALPQVYWHQWTPVFQQLLRPCGLDAPTAPTARVKSVAIVADIAASADPLMDLAASYSAAAVWCRRPESFQARNFDVVWWDDSIAKPTNEVLWRQRMDTIGRRCNTSPRHVWLTNMPDSESVQTAQRAGVDVVLSKPSRIESLLATLDAHEDQPAIFKHTLARAA
jgi:hypothetical protein